MRPRLTHSLRGRLLAFLLGAIVFTALVQGTIAYRGARAEADALFDYHMQQMALSLRAGLPVLPQGPVPGHAREDDHFEFLVQVWTADGLRIVGSSAGLALPQRAVLGFSNVQARGATYRVYSLQTHSQVIQVAQDMAVRRELAGTLAARVVLPIAAMAPLLMLLAWWVVGSSLAPVARVSGQLAARGPQDPEPVPEAGLPDEVRPLVRALNALLERVRAAFEAQQHFVADAAHELRSPLAALKLQVQGLRRAPDDVAREQAVARLGAGIDRATRLVEQLLVLARQQAQATGGEPAEALDLVALAREAVADAAPAAAARGLDLGLGTAEPGPCTGHPQALRILLRNLLDNAVRYTPPGGTVDLELVREAGAPVLRVEDSGPGIPPTQRERVLDRFYRLPGSPDTGSGLGLAIVQAVARLHGATLVLDASPRLGGLRVTLRFPAPKDGPGPAGAAAGLLTAPGPAPAATASTPPAGRA